MIKKSFNNLLAKYIYFKKKELNNLFYNVFKKDYLEEKIVSHEISQLFYRKSTYYSKIRVKCHFTNKSRAILTKFMMYRMSFKELAVKGSIQGIKKASW